MARIQCVPYARRGAVQRAVGASIARLPKIVRNLRFFKGKRRIIACGDVILHRKITGRAMLTPATAVLVRALLNNNS